MRQKQAPGPLAEGEASQDGASAEAPASLDRPRFSFPLWPTDSRRKPLVVSDEDARAILSLSARVRNQEEYDDGDEPF